jgi:protein PET100
MYLKGILLATPRLTPEQKLPVDQSALREELARIKAEKLARRLEREQANEKQ